MLKKSKYLFIFVLLLSACASSNLPVSDNGKAFSKSIEMLLRHFPARSALESQVLSERLLAFGEAGIAGICAHLQTGGDLQTQAEFALGLLAEAVTRPEYAAKRKMFNRALGKALQGDLTPENKTFLIAQLQIAGNDAAVPVMAALLGDPRLADPALRALAAIRTPKAFSFLTNAYENAERAQKPAILQAIAFSDDPQAGQFLQRERQSEDARIAKLAKGLLASSMSSFGGTLPNPPSNKTNTVQSAESLLNSPDAATRLQAIENLMVSGDPAAVDILLAHLQAVSHESEIQAIEKALLHLPVREKFNTLAAAVPTLPVSARVAILRVLTARHAESESLLFFQLAASDPYAKVRITALKGLQAIGPAEILTYLLPRILLAETPAERSTAIQAFAAIARNENAMDRAVAFAQTQFDNADSTQRIALLPVFGKLAGQQSLETVAATADSGDEMLRDTAIRELSEWPEPSALPHLLEIAKNSDNLAHHVLALRGCARLMASDSLTENEKVRIFDDGMAIARRTEEKKLFLASLQKVQTPVALARASHFIADSDLDFEATLAAIKIAEIEGAEQLAFSQQEMVFALIKDRLPPEVKSQVRDYLDAQLEHNLPPEGFVALFNGVDLSGWKGLVKNPVGRAKMSPEALAREQAIADSIMREHWFVENGVLKFDGTKFYNLCTAKDYGDFELLLDWKIAKGGDSGIYLRGAPQVQIWDPDLPNASVGSGGLYNNQQHCSTPLMRADRPTGEWNTFRILMIGEKVTVYLNDVLVVDNVMLENYWQRNLPIYATGQIELQ
ncbi:MAG: DUF1080 domain-containing protein, partial [bacterium]